MKLFTAEILARLMEVLAHRRLTSYSDRTVTSRVAARVGRWWCGIWSQKPGKLVVASPAMTVWSPRGSTRRSHGTRLS
jgi:hypothetical protein